MYTKMCLYFKLPYTWVNRKYSYKRKLSKQLEQKQNHRNGDHMEGYQ